MDKINKRIEKIEDCLNDGWYNDVVADVDINFLLTQLKAVRKENKRLKKELKEHSEQQIAEMIERDALEDDVDRITGG